VNVVAEQTSEFELGRAEFKEEETLSAPRTIVTPSLKRLKNILLSDEFISILTKHEHELLTKRNNLHYNSKYRLKRSGTLYGNLSRVWTPQQLIQFFKTFPEGDVKKNLLRAAFYGVRIGEVASMQLMESSGLVRIETEKKRGVKSADYLPIIEGTQCLFTAKTYNPNFLRKCFMAHCKKMGEGYYYAYTNSDAAGKKRYRYTTHTLRKTAGNMVRRFTKEVFKEKAFLRQSLSRAFGATAAYMDYPEDEMREDLNACFASLVIALLSL
jgi:hypothetical protein